MTTPAAHIPATAPLYRRALPYVLASLAVAAILALALTVLPGTTGSEPAQVDQVRTQTGTTSGIAGMTSGEAAELYRSNALDPLASTTSSTLGAVMSEAQHAEFLRINGLDPATGSVPPNVR